MMFSQRTSVRNTNKSPGGAVEYTTVFGSLDSYDKGTIEIIDDDPKHYAFSNMFEVAATSAPYEKVAVGKNQQYVVEGSAPRGRRGGAPATTTRPYCAWTARSTVGRAELDDTAGARRQGRIGRRRR